MLVRSWKCIAEIGEQWTRLADFFIYLLRNAAELTAIFLHETRFLINDPNRLSTKTKILYVLDTRKPETNAQYSLIIRHNKKLRKRLIEVQTLSPLQSMIKLYRLLWSQYLLFLNPHRFLTVSLSRSINTSAGLLHDDHTETDKPISPRMQEFKKKLREKTPIGKLDEIEGKHPYQEKEPLEAWPDNTNPHTGEVGGPRGKIKTFFL